MSELYGEPRKLIPYGLIPAHVNYVVAQLNLEGQCDYKDGILYVPEEYEQDVLNIVKEYRKLAKNAEGY